LTLRRRSIRPGRALAHFLLFSLMQWGKCVAVVPPDKRFLAVRDIMVQPDEQWARHEVRRGLAEIEDYLALFREH
jgi:hypothetical protein